MASSSHGSGTNTPNLLSNFGDEVVIYLRLSSKKEGDLLPKNPFIVSKSIQQLCGKIENAYVENKGTSMVLKVRSRKQAATLLKMTQLFDKTQIVITEHPTRNRVKGIVSCSQSLNCTEEELKEGLKDQGVIDIRRFNGKDRKPTATMELTYSGTVLPQYAYFGFTRATVRPYTPAPMLCYKCYKYGHTKTRCQAAEACRNCSKEHTITLDKDNKTICNQPPFCVNCAGAHSPTDKKCPKFVEEQEIVKIRSEMDVSFGEARRIFNARHLQSYANTVAAGNSNVQQRIANAQAQESEIVKQLRKEIADNKKALEGFTKELTAARKAIAEVEMLKKELAEAREAKRGAEKELKKLRKQKEKHALTTTEDEGENDNNNTKKKKKKNKNQENDQSLTNQQNEADNIEGEDITDQMNEAERSKIEEILQSQNMPPPDLPPAPRPRNRSSSTSKPKNRSRSPARKD